MDAFCYSEIYRKKNYLSRKGYRQEIVETRQMSYEPKVATATAPTSQLKTVAKQGPNE